MKAIASEVQKGAQEAQASIRVFVVEDQPAVLAAQARLLQAAKGIDLVGTAASGEEALERIHHTEPQVVLCDLGLPGIDGIEVTRRLRQAEQAPEVLVLTVFDDEERVLAAIRAGAAGYLLKGAALGRVVEAIQDVHAGGTVIQPSLARLLLRHFQPAEPALPPAVKLTPREQEILQIVGKGLSNREAAEVLGCSRATVRTHLEHIYDKLDVTNRVEAVAEGLRHGLIES